MAENIRIVIRDDISPTIAPKLENISVSAEKTHISLKQLQVSLKNLGATNITSFTRTSVQMNKAAAAAVKLQIAQEKLQTQAAQTALVQQRVRTEVAKTEAAWLAAEAQLNKAIVTENRAAASAARLSSAQSKAAVDAQRVVIANNKVTESSARVAIAFNNEVASLNRLAAAESAAAAGTAKALAAQEGIATATAKRVSAEQAAVVAIERTAQAQNRTAISANKAKVAEEQLAVAKAKTVIANNKAVVSGSRVNAALAKESVAANKATASLKALEIQTNRVNAASKGAAGGGIRSFITSVLAFTAFTAVAGGFTTFLDATTELDNKLKTVSKSLEQTTALSRELNKIANDTRVPIEETTKAFVRFDLAISQLGKSQQEVLDITSTINKALILGGATSSEASSALLQLSQAFNKGKLDGDEFRSVMELIPKAADAFAKELGVSRGELIKLAPQGKITAEVMVNALQSIRESVDRDFAQTIPTIGQSFTVLRNKTIQAFGEFDKSVGFTRALSKAILVLADNIGTIGKVAGVASVALLGLFGPSMLSAIGAATVAVKGLILAAGPFGLIATAITTVISALILFGDEVKVTSDGVVSLKDITLASLQLMGEIFVDVFSLIKGLFLEIFDVAKLIFKGIIDIVKLFGRILIGLLKPVFNFILKGFLVAFNGIVQAWQNLPEVFDGIFFTIADATITVAEFIYNKFRDLFQGLASLASDFTSVLPGSGDLSARLETFSNAPDVTFDRPTRGFFGGSTRREAEAVRRDIVGNINKDLFARDPLGDAADVIVDVVNVGLEDWNDAVEVSTKELNRRARVIAEQRRKDVADFNLNQKRQRIQGSGSDSDSSGSGRDKAGPALDEKFLREQFVRGIRTLVGQGVDAEQCAVTVRRGAEVAGLPDFDVTSNPIDASEIRRLNRSRGPGNQLALTGPDLANSFFGSDVSRFTDRSRVKPGDLVALRRTYGQFGEAITHVASVVEVMQDGAIRIVDTSSAAGARIGRAAQIVERDLDKAFRPDQIVGFATPKVLLGKETNAQKEAEKQARLEEKRVKTLELINFQLVNQLKETQLLNEEREIASRLNQIDEQFSRSGFDALGAGERQVIEERVKLVIEETRVQNIRNGLYQESIDVERNYGDTIKAVNQLLADKKISEEFAAKALIRTQDAYDNLKNPLKQYQDAIEKERELLKLNSEEREVLSSWFELEAQLRSQGVVLTDESIKKRKEEIRSLQQERRERELLDNLLSNSVGRRRDDITEVGAIAKLRDDPTSGFTEGDAAQATTDLLENQGFDTSTLQIRADAEIQIEKDKNAVLKELREQNLISQKDADRAAFLSKLEMFNQELSAAESFFGNFTALSRSKNRELAAIGKAAAIAQAITNTAQGVTKVLAEFTPPFSFIAAAGVAAAGAAQIATIRSQSPGFQSGGFTGSGPRNQVAGVVHGQEFVMNAAATSRIGVSNLQRLQDGGTIQGTENMPQQASQVAPVVINNAPPNVLVVSSKEEALMAMSGKEGETIFMEHLENNKTAVTRVLS